MKNNLPNLPNLSTWHRVPVGATIPAFSAYAYASKDALMVELRGRFEDITVPDSDNAYYTEFPVTPPLPTEEGATILVSYHEWPPGVLLTRKDGHWVNRYGTRWNVARITSWCPVTLGLMVPMR